VIYEALLQQLVELTPELCALISQALSHGTIAADHLRLERAGSMRSGLGWQGYGLTMLGQMLNTDHDVHIATP
jgi:hypothetical protein